MIATDAGNIMAYYTDSRGQAKRSFDELLNDLAKPFERWPIRNREPREPISSQKRAIIHERDAGECQLCATTGHVLTVDHRAGKKGDILEDLQKAANYIQHAIDREIAKRERGTE